MQWEILVKYFIHGILFTVIFLLLGIAWAFAIIFLVGLGLIIGLIIGLGLLFLIVGFINMCLGAYLWDIQTEMGFWELFFHGLVLFAALVMLELIAGYLPNYAFPETITFVLTFILRAFLSGVIGKYVASWFGQESLKAKEKEDSEDYRQTEKTRFRF